MHSITHLLNNEQDQGTLLSEQNSSEQKQMLPAIRKF